MIYHVYAVTAPHRKGERLPSVLWKKAEAAPLGNVRNSWYEEHPEAEVRLLYDEAGLYLKFTVRHECVRVQTLQFQGNICADSCAEFFVQPVPGGAYTNIEVNASGAMLAYKVTDWKRTGSAIAALTPFPDSADRRIKRWPAFKGLVDPERKKPCDWSNEEFIPFDLLTEVFGCKAPVKGDEWRGNFFKCGDETGHPHWISWNPLIENNFHTPDNFGTLIFR